MEPAMSIHPIRYAAVVAAGLLSLPAGSWAQSPSASPPSAASPSGPTGATAARVEARIKELHTQIGITQAEAAQWDQFAQVMRDNARDMDRVLSERAQQFPSMNAIQDMQSYQKVADAHAQHLQKLVPAFENLYAALSPEQKQKADQAFHARSASRTQAGSSGQR
jgi:hypothetical protein